MPDTAKITTGPNSRARNTTIGQTGVGLPDDSSSPIEVTPDEEQRISEALLKVGKGQTGSAQPAQPTPEMPYDVDRLDAAMAEANALADDMEHTDEKNRKD